MATSGSGGITAINHYVPRWYQYGFMPAGTNPRKYHYLDLKPERVNHPGGGFHYRTARRRLGPDTCFQQEHLYTLLFGDRASDIIERQFFGAIDDQGANAVPFFADYQVNEEATRVFQPMARYMDAQKLRTPKGLDFLAKHSGGGQDRVLRLMGQIHQIHVTIWLEGVWEVLECDASPTKFIVTDHPVTTYNKGMFPLSRDLVYPYDAPITLLGTHTIFPLNLNRCLVITNLGYVRNPAINPMKPRENPRTFATTMWDIRKVQTGRQISEREVQAINFILKSRASRYIAAAEEDWLYPERHLPTTMWNKLGDKFFLMPDPRKASFTTGIFAGGGRGPGWGQDEYGRIPNDRDPAVIALRNAEFRAHQKHKAAWDQKFGPLARDDLMRWF